MQKIEHEHYTLFNDGGKEPTWRFECKHCDAWLSDPYSTVVEEHAKEHVNAEHATELWKTIESLGPPPSDQAPPQLKQLIRDLGPLPSDEYGLKG